MDPVTTVADRGTADMTTLTSVVVGILLLAYGLVHLLFIVPSAADPTYPFSLDRSWLLPESCARPSPSW